MCKTIDHGPGGKGNWIYFVEEDVEGNARRRERAERKVWPWKFRRVTQLLVLGVA